MKCSCSGGSTYITHDVNPCATYEQGSNGRCVYCDHTRKCHGLILPWNNVDIVRKTPLVTVFLLESGNVNQIVRMWSAHSSLGQSWLGWLCVNLALWLWMNFYRVICPDEKFAYWATVVGIFINACVISTVLYFNFIG